MPSDAAGKVCEERSLECPVSVTPARHKLVNTEKKMTKKKWDWRVQWVGRHQCPAPHRVPRALPGVLHFLSAKPEGMAHRLLPKIKD